MKNRDRSASTPSPEHDDGECGAGLAIEDPPLNKKRKTAVSRKGKDKEIRQTEAKGKKNRGSRAAGAVKSRKRRHSSSDDHSDDGPDIEKESAGPQEVRLDLAPSAPLSVQLRPRVKPRVRKAKAPEQLP